MDGVDAVSAGAAIASAAGTLLAVAAAVWAAVSARNDAKSANARLLGLQAEQDDRRRRERADARAIELAQDGAVDVYITARWTAPIDADRNSFGFVWAVGTARAQQIRVVAARTVGPFVRNPSEQRPRDLLAESGGPFPSNAVTAPVEHSALASFASDADISAPPPVEIEFIDQLDNRWLLGPGRVLTLLNPRVITAAPSSPQTPSANP